VLFQVSSLGRFEHIIVLVEATDEISDIGVTLDSRLGWDKQKFRVIAKHNEILTAVHACVARTSDIKVKFLESVCQKLSEPRMIYNDEIWC
jgi:hypothetical protein